MYTSSYLCTLARSLARILANLADSICVVHSHVLCYAFLSGVPQLCVTHHRLQALENVKGFCFKHSTPARRYHAVAVLLGSAAVAKLVLCWCVVNVPNRV